MRRQEFVDVWRTFVSKYDISAFDGCSTKSVIVFAQYFLAYLESFEGLADHEGTPINSFVPCLMVDAYEKLRTEVSNQEIVCVRYDYEIALGRPMSNILNLYSGDPDEFAPHCYEVRKSLAELLEKVTGDSDMSATFLAYCQSQELVLNQTMHRFVRQVYEQGMAKMIEDSTLRSMSGKFGRTTLRTYVLAGVILFTFARKTAYGEDSLTFIAPDDGNYWRIGVQSALTDLPTALAMVYDVIDKWPSDTLKQKKIFRKSKKVSIG